MYVSITGLKPKGLWGLIKFWTLAVPTFREAQVAKGNRHCAVKRIQGYQCTVTAWENRDLMLNFMMQLYMYEFQICEKCEMQIIQCEFRSEVHDIIKQYDDGDFYCLHKFIEIFKLND